MVMIWQNVKPKVLVKCSPLLFMKLALTLVELKKQIQLLIHTALVAQSDMNIWYQSCRKLSFVWKPRTACTHVSFFSPSFCSRSWQFIDSISSDYRAQGADALTTLACAEIRSTASYKLLPNLTPGSQAGPTHMELSLGLFCLWGICLFHLDIIVLGTYLLIVTSY